MNLKLAAPVSDPRAARPFARWCMTVPTLILGLLIACAAVAQPAPRHLRVLATHDFHGALLPSEYPWSGGRLVGGAVALEAYMTRAEEACACAVVRLDGGDQMQGTLISNLLLGEASVAMFNRLELDASAVGNHEFDWGLDTLRARRAESSYPWLAANIYLRDSEARPDWAQPYTLIERDGVRVGVVGYATRETPATLRPTATAGLDFRAGYESIRAALDAVWLEAPDFVVILAHADGQCSVEGCTGELVELAQQLPPGRVHLILGGHDHREAEGFVNGIPIMRAGANGRALGIVDLFRLADGGFAFRATTETLYVDAISADGTMSALLAPYLAEAERMGNAKVTTLGTTLSSRDDRRLGNMIAAAIRTEGRADFGMHNPGGVRANLMAGDISYEDVYSVLPFGNMVVTLTLTGAQLRAVVQQAGEQYYYANLVVTRAADGTGLALARDDGAPIRDEAQYTLALPDFLADGGDGFSALAALPREASGVSLLDALIKRLGQLPAP